MLTDRCVLVNVAWHFVFFFFFFFFFFFCFVLFCVLCAVYHGLFAFLLVSLEA